MNPGYTEQLCGETLIRRSPGIRHELICHRLHASVHASVSGLSSTRLLPARAEVRLSNRDTVRPDLALVTAATGRVWLVAEVVSSDDHKTDTVLKKQIYEEAKVPRLWMIDPRYDNVEVYHSTPYGLSLKSILAGRETLVEPLLPEFQIAIAELFRPAPNG